MQESVANTLSNKILLQNFCQISIPRFFTYSEPIEENTEYLSDKNSVIQFCNLMCLQQVPIFICSLQLINPSKYQKTLVQILTFLHNLLQTITTSIFLDTLRASCSGGTTRRHPWELVLDSCIFYNQMKYIFSFPFIILNYYYIKKNAYYKYTNLSFQKICLFQ